MLKKISFLICLSLSLPALAENKKKERAPSSENMVCITVKSVYVASGTFLVNNDISFLFKNPTAMTLGLQTIQSALIGNNHLELCTHSSELDFSRKKITADWPALLVREKANY